MKFIEQIKIYYRNKPMLVRYFIIGFLVIVILVQFIGSPKSSQQGKIDVHPRDTVSFAGTAIPLNGKYEHNQEYLDREIAITKLDTAQFIMIHKREKKYFDYIEKRLKQEGIPDDFKYLAVAESALRNVAYSSVGAAGIWQFMPETARRYGLRVDYLIDERLDFQKSTEAAIVYLKDLYELLDDWVLVAAAYNRGENGLQRDMYKQKVNNYFDLWLNSETSRYVFRISALKYLMENRYDHFNSDILGNQYQKPKTKVEFLGATTDLITWAVEHGYTYKEIRELNPWIISNELPDGEWEVEVYKR